MTVTDYGGGEGPFPKTKLNTDNLDNCLPHRQPPTLSTATYLSSIYPSEPDLLSWYRIIVGAVGSVTVVLGGVICSQKPRGKWLMIQYPGRNGRPAITIF